jgi:hypothetical protein
MPLKHGLIPVRSKEQINEDTVIDDRLEFFRTVNFSVNLSYTILLEKNSSEGGENKTSLPK